MSDAKPECEECRAQALYWVAGFETDSEGERGWSPTCGNHLNRMVLRKTKFDFGPNIGVEVRTL